jgi:hypothetical protein
MPGIGVTACTSTPITVSISFVAGQSGTFASLSSLRLDR